MKGSASAETQLTLSAIVQVVGYLVGWLFGILAAVQIDTYGRNVKGIVYRAAMRLFSVGFFSIILASVATQLIRAIDFESLSLGVALGVVYAFLVLIAIGYILVAKASNKLTKIEII